MNMFMEIVLSEERVDRFLGTLREVTDEGCWLWGRAPTGRHREVHVGRAAHRVGQQRRTWGSVRIGAHVFSYLLFVGPVPDGRQVLHTCAQPECVQPGHLYAGTHDENMADRLRDGGYRSVTGERQHNARVTDAEVLTMRAQYAAGGVTFYDLAELYAITWRQAWNIVRGKQRAGLPGAVPVTDEERRRHGYPHQR